MNSATDTTTTAPERTTAQRLWDSNLGRAVWAIDLVAQGLAAILSRFTHVGPGVHIAVWWTQPGYVDAYKEAGLNGTGAYILRLGRVECVLDYKVPKATQAVHHAG